VSSAVHPGTAQRAGGERVTHDALQVEDGAAVVDPSAGSSGARGELDSEQLLPLVHVVLL
jgi:hypothetical protein